MQLVKVGFLETFSDLTIQLLQTIHMIVIIISLALYECNNHHTSHIILHD